MVLKEGVGNIPSEVWISLSVLSNWTIDQLLDYSWEKIKGLVRLVRKKDVQPIIQLNADRKLIINLNVKEEKLEDALKSLSPYILSNPSVNDWIWYNEDLDEWGDFDRVAKWKGWKR